MIAEKKRRKTEEGRKGKKERRNRFKIDTRIHRIS